MAVSNDLTTLVCLFHHQEQADAALADLIQIGVPHSSISVLDRAGSEGQTYSGFSLQELGVPERDQRHLMEGLEGGGVIVAVSAIADHVAAVEDIFQNHRAEQIDEADSSDHAAGVPLATGVEGTTAIPVIEEQLAVGKRTVDQGGVRVFRRIVEIPVEQSVNLREEHVNVERRAVDRPIGDRDRPFQGDRVIELTETAEEAVVGKNARVVEEVLVGKNTTQRTEQIRDTVRKTEVEVEEIAPNAAPITTSRKL